MAQEYRNFVVVMCDHSVNGAIGEEIKREFPGVVVLRGDPSMWWTAATNRCVAYALEQGEAGDYVFTLNNDTVLESDCLKVLMDAASSESNLILGCVNLLQMEDNPMNLPMVGSDSATSAAKYETITATPAPDEESSGGQQSGYPAVAKSAGPRIEPSAQIRYSLLGFTQYRNIDALGDLLGDRNGMQQVDTLSGKGVLIPLPVFKHIGLYNEIALPHYHADTEFSVRTTKNGYRLFVHYGARLYSWHEETGMNARNTSAGIAAFLKGFSSVKSTRHFPSIVNLNRLLHGWKYPFYVLINLMGITGGFLRRYMKSF
jgi:GT2 family glycosyltransferase